MLDIVSRFRSSNIHGFMDVSKGEEYELKAQRRYEKEITVHDTPQRIRFLPISREIVARVGMISVKTLCRRVPPQISKTFESWNRLDASRARCSNSKYELSIVLFLQAIT